MTSEEKLLAVDNKFGEACISLLGRMDKEMRALENSCGGFDDNETFYKWAKIKAGADSTFQYLLSRHISHPVVGEYQRFLDEDMLYEKEGRYSEGMRVRSKNDFAFSYVRLLKMLNDEMVRTEDEFDSCGDETNEDEMMTEYECAEMDWSELKELADRVFPAAAKEDPRAAILDEYSAFQDDFRKYADENYGDYGLTSRKNFRQYVAE